REAFDWFGAQIKTFPVDHPLYWITWHELFQIRLDHLKATGELLTMPPTAVFPDSSWCERYGQKPPGGTNDAERDFRSPGGLHHNSRELILPIYGNLRRGSDAPAAREFVLLTPENPSVTLDFKADPVTANYRAFTRYFYANPKHFITSLDVELQHEAN